ncbi:MAG: hypothetical protein V3T58_07205 [Candidatus Hydrothermarchaeales archaeon]
MSIVDEVLAELKDISNTQKTREFGDYLAATAIFDVEYFDEVIRRIESVVAPIIENGEKIFCELNSGDVVDSRVKCFDILRGAIFEVYDYKRMAASFIRLYHLKGEKEWLALYVDENPHTPWWSREERGN